VAFCARLFSLALFCFGVCASGGGVLQAPPLLVQHPSTTTAAHQQLCQLVTDSFMRKQLLLQLPELLLLGTQLRQALQVRSGQAVSGIDDML